MLGQWLRNVWIIRDDPAAPHVTRGRGGFYSLAPSIALAAVLNAIPIAHACFCHGISCGTFILWRVNVRTGQESATRNRSSAHEGLATDMHFAITGISKVRDAAARNCVCTAIELNSGAVRAGSVVVGTDLTAPERFTP
jgi:hypothetical protein